MELSSLTPEMPALLAEMGVAYNPDKLSEALSTRPTGVPAARRSQHCSSGSSCSSTLAACNLLLRGRCFAHHDARWSQLPLCLLPAAPSPPPCRAGGAVCARRDQPGGLHHHAAC